MKIHLNQSVRVNQMSGWCNSSTHYCYAFQQWIEIETLLVTHYTLKVQLLIYNCYILVGFPVCLRCPNIKPLVKFLDWWWRHMALISRSFNLSLSPFPEPGD